MVDFAPPEASSRRLEPKGLLAGLQELPQSDRRLVQASMY